MHCVRRGADVSGHLVTTTFDTSVSDLHLHVKREVVITRRENVWCACRWNIAPHDFAVKQRKLQEFLDKGKAVAVAVTYDHRAKTWQEQYPKAVEVRPPLPRTHPQPL